MSEQLKEQKQEDPGGKERRVSEEAIALRGVKQDRLLRLKQVLEIIPISKSTFWEGCRTGRFPKPIKLGSRITCWRESEIMALVEREG